jgi:hypothetical protein
MSSDARKKEKHRLKRLKKKKEFRRLESVSPFRRAAFVDGGLECYTNAAAREQGLMDYIILGRVPGRSFVMSALLIDLWCVGLKDAWGRPMESRGEFEETILEPWKKRFGHIVRADPDNVRRWVAGAIQFSRQNGFRLPEHWERYTAILGNLDDVGNADLSGFGIDGGLRYVGDFDFLRRRLVGSTVEEFLRRPDVKYITSADSLEWDDEASEDDVELGPGSHGPWETPEIIDAERSRVGEPGGLPPADSEKRAS